MSSRWDGKIGKIPRIGDRKPGRRFSPKLGEAGEFHECRERDYDKERSEDVSRGRPEGLLPEFSPDDIGRYKSQYERYQRGVELTIDGIIKREKKVEYRFLSCNSLSGYWTVTVETTGATYLRIKKPVWQILCPKPIDFDVIDSDGDTFTWTQTRGERTVLLNKSVLSPTQSIAFDTTVPKLDILSLCLNNGCADGSAEPIVLNVQPDLQPELFQSVIIYTTPTDIVLGLSFTPGRGVINAPLDCQLVEPTIAEVALPRSLQSAYFYECTSNRKRYMGWTDPTCDVDKLVGFTIQKTTPTQSYFDVQSYSVTDRRLFVADANIQYRILSFFELPNSTQIVSKSYFFFNENSANHLLIADDTFRNKHSRYLRSEDERVFYLPKWLNYKLERLPLSRQVFYQSDNFNDISKTFTTSREPAVTGAQMALSSKEIDVFLFGFKLETTQTITRLNLDGIIIG